MPTEGAPRRWPAALLALPAVTVIVVFMVVPMGIAFVDSIMTPSAYGGVEPPFTIASYLRFVFERDLDDTLVFDPTYLRIFARSLWLALATTGLCIVLSLPVAWFMATRRPGVRRLLVLLVTIPFWTNLLIRIYCWVLLLRDEGLVNRTLEALGLTHAPITFLYSDGAILMGLVYASLPFMILPVYATLETADPRLVEAAYDLYAGRWDVMRHLVWPLARPGIGAGSLLVFMPALGSFLAPDILGGGRHLMIGSLIQQQFSSGRDWAFGSALSCALMVVVLGALMGSAWRRAGRTRLL